MRTSSEKIFGCSQAAKWQPFSTLLKWMSLGKAFSGWPRSGPSRLFGVHPTELGPKEAEMRNIGCDLHSRQQTLAMLDTTTGEIEKRTLKHEENIVREFYSNLPRPVRVGIEATGSMQWFVNLTEELAIECLWDIRQRFERLNRENKNMIDEMRTYSCHCW